MPGRDDSKILNKPDRIAPHIPEQMLAINPSMAGLLMAKDQLGTRPSRWGIPCALFHWVLIIPIKISFIIPITEPRNLRYKRSRFVVWKVMQKVSVELEPTPRFTPRSGWPVLPNWPFIQGPFPWDTLLPGRCRAWFFQSLWKCHHRSNSLLFKINPPTRTMSLLGYLLLCSFFFFFLHFLW